MRTLLVSVGIVVLALVAILSVQTERAQRTTVRRGQETERLSGPDPEFLKVYKSLSSGKTGKSTKSVEILPDGTVFTKDEADKILAQSHLSATQRDELAELLRGNELMNEEISDCASPRSTDSDFYRIGIEKKHKIVIFKVFPNCHLPQLLSQLDSLLTAVSPTK